MISSESIPTNIWAGVLRGPGRLTVENIPQWPLDDYGDGDLMLIKIEACGVCGSDFRYFAGENPWAQHTLGRFVPNPPNIVLGHEYAGTVVAVASKQNEHWLGKRVAPICSKTCGKCEDCLNGREHLCEFTVHMGHGQGWGDREFFPGAYATYSLAWANATYEIPANVSFAQAAMMDILAVGVHIVRTSGLKLGQKMLCIGGGPAGNACAQVARSLGATAEILDPSSTATNVATAQNLTVINEPKGNYDAVVDTVGSVKTFDLGLNHLAKAGTLVNVAMHDQQIAFNHLRLGSERKITTSCNFETQDFEQALAWLADGNLSVDEWLVPVALKQIPALFEAQQREGKSAFKLLITDFDA